MRHDIRNVVPGFEDPVMQPKILAQLRHYALSMGFSPHEIAKIKDRRELLMVYKAMKLDELHHQVLAQKQQMSQGGPVCGPGTGTSDSIPKMLSAGEYVIPADVVEKVGRHNFDNLVANHHVRK